MKYGVLELEIAARKAGFKVERPPTLRGRSGVEHRFSLLVSEGARSFGFDEYAAATEVDVIKTFVKKWDTDIECWILSENGEVSEEAKSLARTYRLRILEDEDLWTLFDKLLISSPMRQVNRS